MMLASFTQPAFGSTVTVAYTLGQLTASGKALPLSVSSVILIVGGGYYIVELQTPSSPTSDSGTIRLQNWAGASTVNADPRTTVPAGQAYPDDQFSAVLPNRYPDLGNGVVVVAKAPTLKTFSSSQPTNKTVLYKFAQVDLAAFTMPATGSTVVVGVVG